jgi:cysteine desulfurase
MTYLDANATESLRPAATEACLAVMAAVGNPSSVHRAGRAARRRLEDAREIVAARLGGSAADLVFTSGGTEADALAVHGLRRGRRVIVGATEHDAIRVPARDATVLPVDRHGVADLDVLARLLAEGPALVCLMLANNETGVIQPVAEAARLCRASGAWLHVDAVQAAGRIAVDFASLGAHAMAVSSHKLGGPAGAGALLLAPEAAAALAPLITGGGKRGGAAAPRRCRQSQASPPPPGKRMAPNPWRPCATRPRRLLSRPARSSSAPAPRACRTPPASRCRASRRKPR